MNRAPFFLLYLNVLVVATCGLVYELLAGTLASYVLGDSVTQFSLIIGVYLSALGIGAWLSRFIDEGLARSFIEVELGVALVGGASAPLLFLAFAYLSWFRVALFAIVLVIGTLVGLELPLLMRILKDHVDFRDLVSRVLSFDYLGALVASLLFPIFFVPRLGLVRTSLLFGILNAAVGLWGTFLLRPLLAQRGLRALRARAWIVIGLLAIALFKADALTMLAEENTLPHPIVYAKSSPYQRIVITKGQGGFQLYLNGNLQFNSVDEYRYHEALVHPVLLTARSPRRVLVLGGGDGLAVREILRHPSVESVTLVDLDPDMTALADRYPRAGRAQRPLALGPARARHQSGRLPLGARIERRRSTRPSSTSPIRARSRSASSTRPGSFASCKRGWRRVEQSPCSARHRWSRRSHIGASFARSRLPGFSVHPYQVTVPAFGIWGFALATPQPATVPTEIPATRSRRTALSRSRGPCRAV